MHNTALTCATSLIAKERLNENKESRKSMADIIAQVKAEVKACRFVATLSRPTINRYANTGETGKKLMPCGFAGMVCQKAFKMLVFAEKSFLHIYQVNSMAVERNAVMMRINKYDYLMYCR